MLHDGQYERDWANREAWDVAEQRKRSSFSGRVITEEPPKIPNARMVWRIEPRKVLDGIREGKYQSARDVSWGLLNDKRAFDTMKAEEYGDSQENNLVLAVFEQALDWSLGLAILGFIRGCVEIHKALPKPFDLILYKNGDLAIRTNSGKLFGV